MTDNPLFQKSRHVVGETVFGIKFFFIGLFPDPTFHLPFSRDLRDVEKIEFIRFTVTEAHMVPECCDLSEMVAKHEGYILTDDKGDKWFNQYPCALYGSVVNDGDSRYERAHGNFNDAEKLVSVSGIMSCYDLIDLMCTLNDQIRHYSRDDLQDYVKTTGRYADFSRRLSLMLNLKERIEKEFRNQFNKQLVSKQIRSDSPYYITFVIEDIPPNN